MKTNKIRKLREQRASFNPFQNPELSEKQSIISFQNKFLNSKMHRRINASTRAPN